MVVKKSKDGFMHNLNTSQQSFSAKKGFYCYFNVAFECLIMLVFVLDSFVTLISTIGDLTPVVVHPPDFLVTDIVILYSLSICAVYSISLLFGCYGVWRESRKNLQDHNSKHLSKRKKHFGVNSRYECYLGIPCAPTLVFAVTIDSLVVMFYADSLSRDEVATLYSTTIVLILFITPLLKYVRARRN